MRAEAMIPFPERAKGAVAEGLLRALLEDAGYRVKRFGVEELVGELRSLEYEGYRSLDLPDRLRVMPDLLVLAPDLGGSSLVEVKYRREFDEATLRRLLDKLASQFDHWPEMLVVLMLGNPIGRPRRHSQDHMRALRQKHLVELADRRLTIGDRWERLPMLQQEFTRFKQQGDYYTNSDLITETLITLSRLGDGA